MECQYVEIFKYTTSIIGKNKIYTVLQKLQLHGISITQICLLKGDCWVSTEPIYKC